MFQLTVNIVAVNLQEIDATVSNDSFYLFWLFKDSLKNLFYSENYIKWCKHYRTLCCVVYLKQGCFADIIRVFSYLRGL